ncbi:MAG: VanZ family protein [bacterium]|nr:VanZ family protein [bacterium]
MAWRLTVLAAYAIGTIFLSLLPGRDLSVFGFPKFVWDLAHLPLFAGLTIVCLWATVGGGLWRVVFVCAACFAFSATEEWHQRLVPGRFASLTDLRTNAIGILVGAALWEGYRALSVKQEENHSNEHSCDRNWIRRTRDGRMFRRVRNQCDLRRQGRIEDRAARSG